MTDFFRYPSWVTTVDTSGFTVVTQEGQQYKPRGVYSSNSKVQKLILIISELDWAFSASREWN